MSILTQDHRQQSTRSKERFALLFIAFFILQFLSIFNANAYESPKFGFFIKNEVNDGNNISGIGAEMWFTHRNSNFGASVLTSIGHGDVTDRNNVKHDYFAWEAGLKLGYFSDVFAYAEVGFDLGELALNDRNEDDEYRIYSSDQKNDFVVSNRRRYDEANNIDGYVGIGAGVKFDHLQIEAFTRLRQIDGEYWKAENQAFTGAKLSVVF
ncbi:MAG: hypothetical protein AXW17_03600 [Colwellia sp. Phe_37]|jgi:hypothetical protein|nr:MAG: hypothetical protein AXW17_03600 [Colwellia sp. Phe_37]|tara:strand:- start:3378 stop:4007 length:630 start_codon:yes stop_codon:yes gene_type:complete